MAKDTDTTKEQTRSLSAWRPFGELEGWPFGAGFPWRSSALFGDSPWQDRPRVLLPAIDVTENDAQYTITAELPGATKDDVEVELHEGILTLRGEKKSEREEKKEQRHYVERSYGSFRRSFQLPANADASRLQASFKDGVLTIIVPKTEEAKPRTIAVKAG
jgi:HSP20 family protein